jgi:hypothetical protein
MWNDAGCFSFSGHLVHGGYVISANFKNRGLFIVDIQRHRFPAEQAGVECFRNGRIAGAKAGATEHPVGVFRYNRHWFLLSVY